MASASDSISRARAKRDARKQTPGSNPAPALALVSGRRVPESKPEPDLLAQPAGPADGHVPALSADLSADTLPLDTARALSALVLEYDRLATRIANLKASQDELKSEIESIALQIPAKRISGSGWHTTRSRNSKTKTEPEKLRENGVDESAIAYSATNCDKNKLAEKGVDPEVIADATVTTWSQEFVLPVVEKEKAKGGTK